MVEPIAVACHDVRMGDLKAGEFAAVIGGGPIGILVALVAQARGARVLLAEVNPFRLQLARDLGIDAVNPLETDLPQLVNERTGGAGADVVFEVSGSQAGADMMTKLPRTRGRIVVVAIYAEAAQGRSVPLLLARTEAVRRARLRAGGFRTGDRAGRDRQAAARPH